MSELSCQSRWPACSRWEAASASSAERAGGRASLGSAASEKASAGDSLCRFAVKPKDTAIPSERAEVASAQRADPEITEASDSVEPKDQMPRIYVTTQAVR